MSSDNKRIIELNELITGSILHSWRTTSSILENDNVHTKGGKRYPDWRSNTAPTKKKGNTCEWSPYATACSNFWIHIEILQMYIVCCTTVTQSSLEKTKSIQPSSRVFILSSCCNASAPPWFWYHRSQCLHWTDLCWHSTGRVSLVMHFCRAFSLRRQNHRSQTCTLQGTRWLRFALLWIWWTSDCWRVGGNHICAFSGLPWCETSLGIAQGYICAFSVALSKYGSIYCILGWARIWLLLVILLQPWLHISCQLVLESDSLYYLSSGTSAAFRS